MSVITRHSTFLGFLSWLIPFVASVPFFDRTGQILISQPLFKSLMVVIGGAAGTALLVSALRRLTPSLASGLALGLYWFTINIALDVLVLVPMSGTAIDSYFYDIGLRYLLIPIIAAGLGSMATGPHAVQSHDKRP